MHSSSLQINWPYVLIAVFIAGGALGFIGWDLVTQPIKTSDNGRSLTHTEHLLTAGIGSAICIALFVAFLWKLYGDWKTTISDDAVSRPTPLGIRTIHWNEVTKVSVFAGVGIHIHAPNRRIVISPYAYRQPDLVFRRVHECLRAHADVSKLNGHD